MPKLELEGKTKFNKQGVGEIEVMSLKIGEQAPDESDSFYSLVHSTASSLMGKNSINIGGENEPRTVRELILGEFSFARIFRQDLTFLPEGDSKPKN